MHVGLRRGTLTVAFYVNGFVLHSGHLHVVVCVVQSFICLHVKHLCSSREKPVTNSQVQMYLSLNIFVDVL